MLCYAVRYVRIKNRRFHSTQPMETQHTDLNRWLQGKDAWNAWAAAHPDESVDFSRIDFSKYREHPTIHEGDWPFRDFKFPKKGDVSFWGAQFGEGEVDFRGAQFGEGDVDFRGAQFGKGDVDFHRAQFGEGEVSFCRSRVKGHFLAAGVRLGQGRYDFSEIDFGGRVVFSDIKNASAASGFSFRLSNFEKSLEIASDEPFGCVVDLTYTRIPHQLPLEGLKCKPDWELVSLKWWPWSIKKARDANDAGRLRRLKELAEGNKDHNSALEFMALEMQAARWQQPGKWWRRWWWDSALDCAFQACSNYGRSERRPLFWLFVVWLGFGVWYAGIAGNWNWAKLWAGIQFSFGHLFLFIPSSREAHKLAKALFSEGAPWYLYLLTFSENLLSIIFLFLLGLALRNRFRL